VTLDEDATLTEEALGEHFGASTVVTVVCLDACEGIEADCIRAIARLVENAPNNVRFILASRTWPACPELADLVLRDAILQIGWSALQFDEEEAKALLPHLSQSAAEIDKVLAFCAGWPAIIRLAEFVSAHGRQDSRVLSQFLDGGEPTLRRYVIENVVSAVGPAVARCLGLSGLSEVVCWELVSEIEGSSSPTNVNRHEDFQDAEPLIRPVDDRPGWYSAHPTIQAVFRYDFARLPRAERARLHLSTSQWFAANDELEQAVHHAVESGDYLLAKERIREAGGVRIFLRCGFPALHRLISEVPTSAILESSALQLCQAVIFGKQGQIETARALVEGVKSSIGNSQTNAEVDEEDVEHIDSLIGIYDDSICEKEKLKKTLSESKEILPRDLWKSGWLSNHLCIAYTILGDFQRAEAEALKALACYQEQGVTYVQAFMLIHLSLINNSMGKPRTAIEFISEARRLIETAHRGDRNLSAIMNVSLAEALYGVGDTEKATNLLDEAIPRLRQGEAWVDLFERAFLIRARIAISKYDSRRALHIADLAEQTARQRRLPRLSMFAGLLKMEVLVRTGLREAADDLAADFLWIREHEFCARAVNHREGRWFAWREYHLGLVNLSRVFWAQGNREEAVSVLSMLSEAAKTISAGIDLSNARALQFNYYWHMQEQDKARANFQLAVALATPQRLVSVFADEGYPMTIAIRGLLRRFGASAFSYATIELTNSIFGNSTKNHVAAEVGSKVDRIEVLLSEHEREILDHLVRGLSNKEIAIQIGRTEATVKYHLRRIYSKFGVRSRGLAVAMARRASIAS
jgi:LuxR family maltose regulon positive regulatory protein